MVRVDGTWRRFRELSGILTMLYEVDRVRSRGRQKMTPNQVVEKDMREFVLNKVNVQDELKWKPLYKRRKWS